MMYFVLHYETPRLVLDFPIDLETFKGVSASINTFANTTLPAAIIAVRPTL